MWPGVGVGGTLVLPSSPCAGCHWTESDGATRWPENSCLGVGVFYTSQEKKIIFFQLCGKTGSEASRGRSGSSLLPSGGKELEI